jgi:hypothetical protein
LKDSFPVAYALIEPRANLSRTSTDLLLLFDPGVEFLFEFVEAAGKRCIVSGEFTRGVGNAGARNSRLLVQMVSNPGSASEVTFLGGLAFKFVRINDGYAWSDTVESLRIILRKVKQTADSGQDAAAIIDVKRILRKRIAEFEAAEDRTHAYPKSA